VTNFADFAALLKRDSAKLNYGSIGYGSLSHLSMAAIAMKSDAHPEHIAYAGSPNVVTALTRNDVQMSVLPAASVVSQAQAGMLKMLAVTSATRSALLPDVSDAARDGIDGVEAGAWGRAGGAGSDAHRDPGQDPGHGGRNHGRAAGPRKAGRAVHGARRQYIR